MGDVEQRWLDGSRNARIHAELVDYVAERIADHGLSERAARVYAPFSAESSGHYYFRESFYADNGLVPFLMIAEMVSKTGKTLSELVAPLRSRYSMIDEINFKVEDPAGAIALIEKALGPEGEISKIDGITIEAKQWRVNLRPSNTEPLIRLNAEAHDQKTLDEVVKRVLDLINT